jgi:hypothetical protein
MVFGKRNLLFDEEGQMGHCRIKLYNERDGETFPTALNATKTLPISVPPLILRISIEYLKAASSM